MRNDEQKDWRLTNQEEYLKGATLQRTQYRRYSPEWDHDHCEFCWAKFMEEKSEDVLGEGYVTNDRRHWICEKCFEDFNALFLWKVLEH